MFHGPAWTRVTEADGQPGQWYLHLFDTGQPDWNWRNPAVSSYFEEIIRFWLGRRAAGLRIDVAHGLFKAPDLADLTGPATASHAPTAYFHRAELQELYRLWRIILDSYQPGEYPGPRTAVGEVWYDSPETLKPYLAGSGLPQVFNFQLILSRWDAAELRTSIDAIDAMAGGARAPWVIGNHDVARPVTRYAANQGGQPNDAAGLPRVGDPEMAAGFRRARAAALLLLALPGSAYIYQGEELGLPEVVELPDEARQDRRSAARAGPCRAGTAAGSRCRGPAPVTRSASPPTRAIMTAPRRGCRSPATGGSTAWPASSASRTRSCPCTGMRSSCAGPTRRSATDRARPRETPAGTRPPGRRWRGWTDRPARCSSGVSPGSCSRPTSATAPCRCRRTARCCWPVTKSRTASCRRTPPSGSAG